MVIILPLSRYRPLSAGMFDEDEDTISIILTRVIDHEVSEDWMKHSHPWTDCRGKHNFKYSLYINGEGEDLYQVMKLAKEKAFKPEVEMKIGCADEEILPCKLSILDIQSDSAVISVLYSEGDEYILRLYEAKGKSLGLKVKSFKKFGSVTAVDFLGNPVERNNIIVSDDNYVFETVLKPWEITNLVY